MILREINKFKEERKERESILEILKNLKLPKKYCIEKDGYNDLILNYKIFNFFKGEIAKINRDGNIIILTFYKEEDYKELKNCLKNSEIDFFIKIGKSFY